MIVDKLCKLFIGVSKVYYIGIPNEHNFKILPKTGWNGPILFALVSQQTHESVLSTLIAGVEITQQISWVTK